jgi:hypothetical protein
MPAATCPGEVEAHQREVVLERQEIGADAAAEVEQPTRRHRRLNMSSSRGRIGQCLPVPGGGDGVEDFSVCSHDERLLDSSLA